MFSTCKYFNRLNPNVMMTRGWDDFSSRHAPCCCVDMLFYACLFLSSYNEIFSFTYTPPILFSSFNGYEYPFILTAHFILIIQTLNPITHLVAFFLISPHSFFAGKGRSKCRSKANKGATKRTRSLSTPSRQHTIKQYYYCKQQQQQ